MRSSIALVTLLATVFMSISGCHKTVAPPQPATSAAESPSPPPATCQAQPPRRAFANSLPRARCAAGSQDRVSGRPPLRDGSRPVLGGG